MIKVQRVWNRLYTKYDVSLDCKTAVFFANVSDGPYSKERLERVKKRRGRMVRDAKKYGCPPCTYQIRSKLPVPPATENSHWSNPDAICHHMSITPHQKDMYQFHWKASWEDERCWLGWTCERFWICFESGAKGRCGIASQRKRCFWCAAYGFGKSLIFQLFVLAKKRASSSPNASLER